MIVDEIPEGSTAVQIRSASRVVVSFGSSTVVALDATDSYHISTVPNVWEYSALDQKWSHYAIFSSAAQDVEIRWYLDDRTVAATARLSPLDLFRPGDEGAFWDFRPPYLFQDAAGTIPAVSLSDPVGYVTDLSGRGHHATQATSTKKPLLAIYSGAFGLAPDDVDDRTYATDPAPLRTTGAVTYGVAWAMDTGWGLNYNTLVCGSGTGTQYGYGPLGQGSATNNFYDPVTGSWRQWAHPTSRTPYVTLTARKNDGLTWITRVDGTEYTDVWPNQAAPSSSQNFMVVGSSLPGSAQFYIFAMFVIMRELSGSERRIAEDWLFDRARGLV